MLNEVSKGEIAQGFCKKSFDHKSILLSFRRGKKEAVSALIIVYSIINCWMLL